MAKGTLLATDLPSEDEADDDYNPLADDTAEKEDLAAKQAKQRAVGRKRKGCMTGKEEVDEDDGEEVADDAPPDPKQLARKAKTEELWERLNKSSQASSSGRAQSMAPGTINLANLCRTMPKKKSDPDRLWMQQLGVHKTAVKMQPSQASQQDKKAAAAAALSAAKTAASISAAQLAGSITVTETRNFAGKHVQVTSTVAADSKAAKKAAEIAKPKSGLDAVLQSLEAAKKVNVLDKTRHDWGGYKGKDAALAEELEEHKKSGGQYLEKVEFLQRAELREYEKERDQRLASDMKTRART